MVGVKANLESTFEASIAEHLTEHSGWIEGDPAEYDRTLAMNPDELIRFVESTQPKDWAKLVGMQGGWPQAVDRFTKYVASEVSARGLVDVLRRGVKTMGTTMKVAYFAPAHDLTPELRKLADANR